MIRLAKKTEVKKIMTFIDTYWKKGHILGINEKMFRYEFEAEEGLNIVVSINDKGEIDGMEGFISYGKKRKDIMLVIWKVNKTAKPMLGIEILRFIKENTDFRIIAAPGINKNVIKLYEYMKMKTGKMTQWYRLTYVNAYNIAVIRNQEIPLIYQNQKKSLKKLSSISELKETFDFNLYQQSNPIPFKELWYIEKRYYKHPIYSYDVYGIGDEEKCDTLLVFRKQVLGDACAYRLVDVIGNFDELYYCTEAIDNLMVEIGAEYVDFYEVGMNDFDMEKAGWRKVIESGNIVPNYFSPYCQENIDINYCTSDETIHLFKADGDQDRPN